MAERKVSWLELFFDLIFVTAVASTTHLLLSVDNHPDKTAIYFGEYLLMVTPMFWSWVGQTMFFNRFGEKIKSPELYMLPQMFFLILMTASFDLTFSNTYYTFLIGYLGIRFITVIQYFVISRQLTGNARKVALLLGSVFLLGVLTTATSVFFEGFARYLVMYLGIAVDIILPLFLAKTLRKVPVDFPHLAERFGLFVIITFGESIVAITTILAGHTLDPYTIGYTLLGFLIICTLWASYFHSFEKIVDHHKETHGQYLIYGHFFIIISVMLLAANVHLLFEGHLERNVLLLMLFGSVAVFFISKQFVFVAHKKAEVTFSFWKDALLLLLLVGLFFVNLYSDLPLFVSFVSIWVCALVDLGLQFRVSRPARV
ncbi:low temperature requirement protein A [Listeria monocytogenes]|uniref:low temperature requirement protein A n=1 Tax=Listeria monocytogenes TaxID=1639 RepID=UPI0011EB41F6|nr:low temperature requirement protein A [Listeria monocytogenes]TYV81541.1 low temperature requirement protein A [Listeria monocytogenes]